MPRQTSLLTSRLQAQLIPIVRLWLLRLLVPLGVHREFVGEHGFANETLAEALGLGKWIESGEQDFQVRAVRSELRRMHMAAERRQRHALAPATLTANSGRLAALVGLSETDRKVLEFAALIHNERLLDDAADWLGPLSSAKVSYVLSLILDLPERDIRAALGPQGPLARSGLVSLDRHGTSFLRCKLDLLSENFADHIFSSDADPVSLLRDTVAPSASAQLKAQDYEHVQSVLDILRPYLGHSLVNGRRGVNVFLHGKPGTGKSELARLMAKELGCSLFEIASEDAEGDPVHGERRLRAFRAAQSFFARQRALLLFDEADDVFGGGEGLLGRKSAAQTPKAWMNRMLEDNPVPTLWIANSIQNLDSAVVRRFDLVFELPIPPRNQRERVLRECCAEFLGPDAIGRISECEHLAPAVATRAASVVAVIRAELGADGAAESFVTLVSNTLSAQGHQPIPRLESGGVPEVYDPAYVHTDVDLAEIVEGLARVPSGRLCLYGAPGTGKTAYARWLAGQLGRPLQVRRASDLLSMWVGGSERNLASTFLAAERAQAVLLIDEVDSFLQDRQGVRQSWEVTLVNEMLTQMEAFPGMFIATTNLLDGFDPAALRRFDLKVEFRFLRADQAAALFERYCAAFGFRERITGERVQFIGTEKLTPGDFAVVARQHRFRPIRRAEDFFARLKTECALKAGVKTAIGF